MVFADRNDAGRQLARLLSSLREARPIVLALPRGGVPVAVEVGRKQ
jgi:predicted phosphoribosyltransferase